MVAAKVTLNLHTQNRRMRQPKSLHEPVGRPSLKENSKAAPFAKCAKSGGTRREGCCTPRTVSCPRLSTISDADDPLYKSPLCYTVPNACLKVFCVLQTSSISIGHLARPISPSQVRSMAVF